MRIFPLFLLCIFYLPAKADTSESLELRVMTFNIRNSYARDGENDWKHRNELSTKPFVIIHPLFLDCGKPIMLSKTNSSALPEYGFVGIGAQGGTKGQYCSILYLKNRFRVDKTETYWLSDTPTVPSSTWETIIYASSPMPVWLKKKPNISSIFTTATWTMVRKKHAKKASAKLESIFSSSQAMSLSSSWEILMLPKTV